MIVAPAQTADTRLGLIVVPLWFLALAWCFNRQTPRRQARIEEWKAKAAADKVALANASR
jgi:hypothetical protein